MSKKIFHESYGVDVPTLLLQNRNFETIGSIGHVHGLTYKDNYNSANELSFSIYKTINGKPNPVWDSVTDLKIIYIPEYKERFEITTSTDSGDSVVKSITAASLCESELSQTMLYDIEINTENDILNEDYDKDFPTVFYRDPEKFSDYDWNNEKYRNYTNEQKKAVLKRSSLLHRILEKAEHYSIGTVDNSLKKMIREFSISNTDIYSELTGEIAEEFNCIFIFDSMTRTISAYDLYNTCGKCGYRGDFSDQCPECGSPEYGGQYGEDTTVFISNKNLAQEISLKADKDSLKNCFYVEGGDDLITSAVRFINPNGTNYIYEHSDDTKSDMPKELSSTIDAYDKLYRNYITEVTFPLDSAAVEHYNHVVQETNQLFKENKSINFPEISQNLTGYPSVVEAIYETADLYEFLQNSMMPTISIDGLGLEESLENIITGFSDGFSVINDDGSTTTYFRNQIALPNHKTAIQLTVENAIKKSARLYYSRAYYDLDIDTLSYEQATDSKDGVWKGTMTLTSLTETDDNGVRKSKTSGIITLTINDNMELYVEQSIYRKITEIDKSKYGEITSLQMDFDTFKEKISLYSFHELERLKESFQACLNIIITANISDFDEELHNKYYHFYRERLDYIDIKELPERDRQLKCIKALYFFDSSAYESSGILYDIKNEVNRVLNFKEYLLGNPLHYDSYDGEQLWKTFCAYRQEDKYSNSNYISDGLSNAGVIKKAKQLLDTAAKELYKAANLQITLSANLNNLLILEEFQPFADSFSCGNWIQVEIDNQVYKLRLLSYQIDFEDIPSIEVEFSTVEKPWSVNSDVKSILDSAKSIAGSYSYTVQQVNNSAKSSKYVENWVEKGLDTTTAKIVNNADNQDILIDRNGILCRKYDDLKEQYDRYQMRIISNGAYLYDTVENTVKTGIGEFFYLDPENNFEKTAGYGVIADTVVGSLILDENLGIYNSNGSLRFDGSGLSITNDGNTICISPNNDSNLIRITNSTGEDVFYTDTDGNLTMSGTVVGSTFIGGQINIGNGTFTVDANGNITSDGTVSFANGGLTYNNPAEGLKVEGIITADSGSKIGNLSIDDNKLTYGNFGIDISSTKPDNIALWLGNASPSDASFRVTYDGKLYAKNGSFTGRIETISGKIGGFTIGSNAIYNGTNSMTSTAAGVYLGTNGIRQYNSATAYVNIQNGILSARGANLTQGVLSFLDDTGLKCGEIRIATSSDFPTLGTVITGNNVKVSGNTELRLYGGIAVNIDGSSVNIKSVDTNITGNLAVTNNIDSSARITAQNNIRFGIESESVSHGILTKWKDGSEHYALERSSDGLDVRVGWIGSSSYKTICTLRSQTVRYSNSSGTTNLSDERLKNSFKSLDEYDSVFMNLKPCAFRYNNGSSGRYHFGFKAQDVKAALEENGFTTKDFAGFVQMKTESSEEQEEFCGIPDPMGLIYTEFVPWAIYKSQKNSLRIDSVEDMQKQMQQQIHALQNEIFALKKENTELKSQIN